MSGRRAVPETYREFGARRLRELRESGELDRLGTMAVTDFIEMLRNEYFECAEDPVPPGAERTLH